MLDIRTAQNAIRRELIDGWLFTSHHHRDSLTEKLLAIPPTAVHTRPWFFYIPREGKTVRIVHGIETHNLDHLPGDILTYSSRKELLGLLSTLSGKKIAVQFSKNLPVISFLDHGTALLLIDAGINIIPSDSLIQRTNGLLSETGILSHERAAVHLYEIVELVWKKVRDRFGHRSGVPLMEGEIQSWILAEFARRGLETDSPPIVASGPHSSDPHYSPSGKGFPVANESVLQLDLWAREKGEDSIYADISWVCFTGDSVPEDVRAHFRILASARDAGVDFIRRNISSGTPVHGAEVDLAVRTVLVSMGYEQFLRHRTGHGIDTEVHGSGVNLDGIEFPDERFLLEGSCFSIEPGIYMPSFGLRTEIDVYIHGNTAMVSGKQPQVDILSFSHQEK